jgi:peptidoglycan/LPS O-acetylase OafA/YrhL
MLHASILSVFIELLWKGHFGVTEVPIFYGVAIGLFTIALSVLTFRNFEKPVRDLLSGRRQREIDPTPSSKSYVAREPGSDWRLSTARC